MPGLYHGWSDEPDTHADFVHGGVAPDDFSEPVKHRKRSSKRRAKRGCPGNDGNEHVYVWVPYDPDGRWPWPTGRYEVKVCAGCEKRAGKNSFRRAQ